MLLALHRAAGFPEPKFAEMSGNFVVALHKYLLARLRNRLFCTGETLVVFAIYLPLIPQDRSQDNGLVHVAEKG